MATACCCTSGPSTTAPTYGRTPVGVASTRGLHAVHHRHHAERRRRAAGHRRARPRRPAGSGQAARQAGLAARAALHLVSPDDRHLADGLAGGRAGGPHPAGALDPQSRPLGDRAESAGRRRCPRRALRCASVGGRRWRDDSYDVVATRCTGGSPSPTRASTTTGTSCSGARASPTLIDATVELHDGAGRCSTGAAATRRCARSPFRGTASC